MNSTNISTLLISTSFVERIGDMAKMCGSFFLKQFIHIQTGHIYHESIMSFLLKVIIITGVTMISLFIGAWIASRIIKMENRDNLIDW